MAIAVLIGSSGSRGEGARDVFTEQKRQPRVHWLPMIMMVAVAVLFSPPPQHSPMLGHLASSHTYTWVSRPPHRIILSPWSVWVAWDLWSVLWNFYQPECPFWAILVTSAWVYHNYNTQYQILTYLFPFFLMRWSGVCGAKPETKSSNPGPLANLSRCSSVSELLFLTGTHTLETTHDTAYMREVYKFMDRFLWSWNKWGEQASKY